MGIASTYVLFLLAQGACVARSECPARIPITYGKDLLRSMCPIYCGNATGSMSLEHIVPRSVILATRPRPPKSALHDMHNIFCAPGTMNGIRGNMRYDSVGGGTGSMDSDLAEGVVHVGDGNYVDRLRRTFCVHPRYQGLVARAALYMCDRYGVAPEDVVCGGERTLRAWHAAHPPEGMELLHNYLVLRMQGGANPFVSAETDPVRALAAVQLRLRDGP